jgi:uncharacterized protein YdbL (DUF1318 family)
MIALKILKKINIVPLALALAMLAVTPAFALDLSTAKDKGLVGETREGLIAVVNPPADPDIRQLVERVNEGRMDVYQKTAKRQDISVDKVQKLAAQKLIKKAESGHYIKKNGGWVRAR